MQSHWELGWEARLAGLGWGGRRLELEGADVEGGGSGSGQGQAHTGRYRGARSHAPWCWHDGGWEEAGLWDAGPAAEERRAGQAGGWRWARMVTPGPTGLKGEAGDAGPEFGGAGQQT